ncbi:MULTISPECIES: DUF4190 domain-containing protein [unclassified Arthrobacter]|uniref:DUF4190 domain-containing protein n=1 Tax=unclassified Arthrobacter TaxID=235627 RepID=UPI001D14EEA2|nr:MULTISPECIES: DUF4190 domain-containing protein [unclassified Arthrobacter]MCC3291589.1 hypothetical protein [Arthrobacter sp. zg-Y1110]MCC3301965.1 hypothetical protein [Arthrobacter sp. zg-Y895]UWX85436.1 hypothetical protein N2K99_02430 [Arthrobacter sp. zg-Y1110]
MSENRPEWQPGGDPAAGNDSASDSGQYAPPPSAPSAYPGSQQSETGNTAYPSYGQQPEVPAYGQQPAYPGSGQEAPAYSQQPGYLAYGQDAYPQPRPNPGQAMGIAGLITSFFFSVVGLVLSIVGLNQSRKVGMGNTPAVIGIIVGGLGTLFGILFFILIMVGIAADSGSSY